MGAASSLKWNIILIVGGWDIVSNIEYLLGWLGGMLFGDAKFDETLSFDWSFGEQFLEDTDIGSVEEGALVCLGVRIPLVEKNRRFWLVWGWMLRQDSRYLSRIIFFQELTNLFTFLFAVVDRKEGFWWSHILLLLMLQNWLGNRLRVMF